MSVPLSRFANRPAAQPQAVNPATGEALDLDAINTRIMRLADELARDQPELQRLLAEHQAVSLRYELEFAAVLQASKLGSEDRRKAEATTAMAKARMDDSPIDLATRRAVLEMQIKAMREAAHNIRAQISGMQTVAADLRAEMTTLGGRV